MLVRTAEPVRYVERMLAARAQRRRQRRHLEVGTENPAPNVELQTNGLSPVVEYWIASWGEPLPAARVRRVRAGYIPAQGAA